MHAIVSNNYFVTPDYFCVENICNVYLNKTIPYHCFVFILALLEIFNINLLIKSGKYNADTTILKQYIFLNMLFFQQFK